jgi:hypothetical protein
VDYYCVAFLAGRWFGAEKNSVWSLLDSVLGHNEPTDSLNKKRVFTRIQYAPWHGTNFTHASFCPPARIHCLLGVLCKETPVAAPMKKSASRMTTELGMKHHQALFWRKTTTASSELV